MRCVSYAVRVFGRFALLRPSPLGRGMRGRPGYHRPTADVHRVANPKRRGRGCAERCGAGRVIGGKVFQDSASISWWIRHGSEPDLQVAAARSDQGAAR